MFSPPVWAAMIKTRLTPPSGPMTNSPPPTLAMKMVEMGIHLRMIPALGEESVSAPSMITKARSRMSSHSKQVIIAQGGYFCLPAAHVLVAQRYEFWLFIHISTQHIFEGVSSHLSKLSTKDINTRLKPKCNSLHLKISFVFTLNEITLII